MSEATEKLRAMLDERGVKWKDGDAAYEIEWRTPDGRRCSAMYWKPTFTVLISGCTPEQAIAATLGNGTCHAVLNDNRTDVVCSACGSSEVLRGWEEFHDWDGTRRIRTFTTTNYCPNCGAKVVSE